MASPVSSWTEARFKGFVVGALRSAFRRFPPKFETLKEACVGKKENKKTKRMAMHYRCAGCKEEFPSSAVNVDHIDPVVDPLVGFVNWDTFITRLYCEKENLQCLCKDCHDKKTREEKKLASMHKMQARKTP